MAKKPIMMVVELKPPAMQEVVGAKRTTLVSGAVTHRGEENAKNAEISPLMGACRSARDDRHGKEDTRGIFIRREF
jgi:hypothetical protein